MASMLKPALQAIAEERERQVEEEGFDAERDDGYTSNELPAAAGSYALSYHYGNGVPPFFPWSHAWYKTTDRRRDLVKAGALIVAEIERLDRAAEQETE